MKLKTNYEKCLFSSNLRERWKWLDIYIEMYNSVMDPGFPCRGRQPQRWGRQPIILATFPHKLHKNEKINEHKNSSIIQISSFSHHLKLISSSVSLTWDYPISWDAQRGCLIKSKPIDIKKYETKNIDVKIKVNNPGKVPSPSFCTDQEHKVDLVACGTKATQINELL